MHIYLLSCNNCHCITHLDNVGFCETTSFKNMINDDENLTDERIVSQLLYYEYIKTLQH